MRHLTLRLPEDLAERIAEARGFSSLNAEIVRRLEQSFGGALGEPEPNAREAGSTFLPPPAKDEADTSPAAVHTGHRTGAGITEASGSPSAKTASEVAASIAGVNLGPASLAKEATPFSKGAQAGRGKT